ncbi:MAG: universal stress protein [Proteobacteria bacterium]|nr:universal stress protein [Pseudomonadota bacterium]
MKIMVCFDGSDSAKEALKIALMHAQAFTAQIVAVTALEGDPQEQLHDLEKAEQALDYARVFLTVDDLVCETKLLSASNISAGENLVRYANDQKVDTVIIGVKKRSKVGKLVTGSTAQHVILHADCPVVAVK